MVGVRLAAILAVGALVVAACGETASELAAPVPAPQAGNTALSGEFTTLDGGSINLAEFEGQDVVLWFWAPW